LLRHPQFCTRIRCGDSHRIVFDTERIAIPSSASGKVLRERQAAKRLGVTVSVLKALKTSGVYAPKHILRTLPGYHERDLEGFRLQFVNLIRPTECRAIVRQDGISAKAIMQNRHYGADVKVALIRALLSGEITVLARKSDLISGLIIDQKATACILATAQRVVSCGLLTSDQTAAELGCSPDAISGLVDLGYLQVQRLRGGVRVSAESAVAFGQSHLPVVVVAKACGTSARAAMRACRDRAISLLMVPMPRQGPQPFLKSADRSRLEQMLRTKRAGRRKRRPEPPLALGALCEGAIYE
jgi:hypothetical protein